MSVEKLGVAVVGLGIGERHARTYHADPRCQLRWLHDNNLDKADALADATGARAGSSYDEILADDQVHIVSIAT